MRLALRPLPGATVMLNPRKRTAEDVPVQLIDTRTGRIDVPIMGTIIPNMGIDTTESPDAVAFRPGAKRTGLANALFTSTQQKVLGLLFGQPNRSFYVTQIMELARSGRGAVQRELQRLETAGLVSVRMVGNQKHYQSNPESPLFDELCSIVRKTVALKEPLRTAVDSLPGDVHLALIYGSVVKGEDNSASDIDVLLVADDVTLEQVFAALSPVEDLLARTVSPTLYTREEFLRRRYRGNAFLKRVLSGPVIPLVESIDDVFSGE
jgi:predicted nucleotidyltransferase